MTADELRAGAERSKETAEFEKEAGTKLQGAAERAGFGQPPSERGAMDTMAGNPEQREQSRAQAVYKQVTARVPGKQDALFRKKKDDGYAYGFKDNVWTVYQGRFPAQPVRRSGTNEPVTFTIEEAKNSKNPNVRELYDLALANNLITFDTLF